MSLTPCLLYGDAASTELASNSFQSFVKDELLFQVGDALSASLLMHTVCMMAVPATGDCAPSTNTHVHQLLPKATALLTKNIVLIAKCPCLQMPLQSEAVTEAQ